MVRLGQVSADAGIDLLRSVRGVSPGTLVERWPDLAEQVAAVLLDAQLAGLEVTGEYLSSLVGSEVAPVWETQLGRVWSAGVDGFLSATPNVFSSRVAAGIEPATALVQGVSFLRGVAESQPWAVSRGSVIDTAVSDYRFQGWARVAEAGACAFCRMLASRGAVYASESTAARTRAGTLYHTVRPNGSGGNCRCTVRAMPRGEGATAWDAKGAPKGRQRQAAQAADFWETAPKYRPGQKTLERQATVRRQLDVLRAHQAAGKGTAWTTSRIAELEAETATF